MSRPQTTQPPQLAVDGFSSCSPYCDLSSSNSSNNNFGFFSPQHSSDDIEISTLLNEESESDQVSELDDFDDSDDEPANAYCEGGYHPVEVGQIYASRYRIEHKLGWGHFSTVWLCLDLNDNSCKALKIMKSADAYSSSAVDEIELLNTCRLCYYFGQPDTHSSTCGVWEDMVRFEDQVFQSLNRENITIEKTNYICEIYDSFSIHGINGIHHCIVFELLGPNLLSLIKYFDFKGIPVEIVKNIMRNLLSGLNFLHENCKIIHTDIKPENILISLNKIPLNKQGREIELKGSCSSVSSFPGTRSDREEQRLCLYKKMHAGLPISVVEANSQNIEGNFHIASETINQEGKPLSFFTPTVFSDLWYLSTCNFKIADLGNSCYIDFSMTTGEIQTRQYRSPEVILRTTSTTPYNYSVDIWSAACVCFELLFGDYLFEPQRTYQSDCRDYDHLRLMIQIFGDLPRNLLDSGQNTLNFYEVNTDSGDYIFHGGRVDSIGLIDLMVNCYHVSPGEAESIANFLQPMLALNPHDRPTAKKCLDHEWLK